MIELINDLKSESLTVRKQTKEALFNLRDTRSEKLLQVILDSTDKDIQDLFAVLDWEQDGENLKSETPFVALKDIVDSSIWYLIVVTEFLKITSSTYVPELLLLLSSARPLIRAWSSYILGHTDDVLAIPKLIDNLGTANDEERIQVMQALARLKATEAVDQLILLLNHEDQYTQSVAADALGEIGDERAIEPLLADFVKHKHNVYSASSALGRFKEKVVDPLIDLLFDPSVKPLHDLIIIELWMIGDERAIDPIIETLNQTDDGKIKAQAINALGVFRSGTAIPSLAKILFEADNIDDRSRTAHVIGEIGGKKAIEVLINALENGSTEVQQSAVLAMGNLKHLDDLEPLLTALKSDNHYIRSGAAVSLGNLRDKRAIDALTIALTDVNQDMRNTVQWALDKIADKRI